MYDSPVALLDPLADDRPTVTFWRITDDPQPVWPVLDLDVIKAGDTLRHTDPPILDVLRRIVAGLRRLA
ncbi:hypothetical protein AB8O38_06445 [Saccharomonospora xinjiangensis]|uniref:hypothetical protein n=1 Tax=Saccharomonospora xinjiangensis TaxID=75294 RepID=UPI00351005B6